jgi:thymine-DNA glycosylase
VPCEEDRTLPTKYLIGQTNIVSRPTRDTAELSLQEQADGTPILEAKVRKYRPESVCCVGKSVWEAIFRHWNGRKLKKTDDFKYGWQYDDQGKEVRMGKEGDWVGARVFVAPSTSGLAASLSMDEKVEIFKQLGDWVNERRREREAESHVEDEEGLF